MLVWKKMMMMMMLGARVSRPSFSPPGGVNGEKMLNKLCIVPLDFSFFRREPLITLNQVSSRLILL